MYARTDDVNRSRILYYILKERRNPAEISMCLDKFSALFLEEHISQYYSYMS
jgi:hypothetical protein